jgi:hypothetical protein
VTRTGLGDNCTRTARDLCLLNLSKDRVSGSVPVRALFSIRSPCAPTDDFRMHDDLVQRRGSGPRLIRCVLLCMCVPGGGVF